MAKVPQTMAEGLTEASEGLVHAMMAPDAAPHMQVLTKLLAVTTQMAKGGQPGAGGQPGQPPAPGPPGAGAGAPNPMMPGMGGPPPGPPPGTGPGGPTPGIPSPQGDDLRRMLAGAAGA